MTIAAQLSRKIDVHVNLLPPFSYSDDDSWLASETESLRRAFSHTRRRSINSRASCETIANEMDKASVGSAICFSFQWNSHALCVQGNDFVSAEIGKYSDKFRALAVVQPKEGVNAADELQRRLTTTGFVGLKVKPKWGGFSLADIEVMGPLCEILMSRNAVLLTHISQNFHTPQGDSLSDLFVLLKNFPKLKVIAAHLGGFAGVYSCYEPLRMVMENLVFDISLPANLEWLPSLMRLGGGHRYLYGSDFPYCEYNEIDKPLERLGLTDMEIDQLLWRNAEDFFDGVPGWRDR